MAIRRGHTVARALIKELRYSGLAAWRAVIGLVTRNDLTHAAAIAYYALLSLFPFLLLMISILGAVTADEMDRARVIRFLFLYFPTRFDFLADQLDAFRAEPLRTGLASGLGLVWGSLGFFGAVTSAVNEAWGVEKQRDFWKHRLVSFLMLVAAGAAMTVALLIVGLFQVAEASWVGRLLASYQWLVVLQTILFRYLALLLLMFGLGLMFYFLPNAQSRFRDVWVGAILTGLLWRGVFSGFAWYLRHNERLTMIHGSVAAVIVFLFWVYVSAVILMWGVEFTAAYARLRRHRTDAMPAAATPRT